MASDVDKLLLLADSLETELTLHRPLFNELAAICFPRRGELPSPGNPPQGVTERGRVTQNYDGTAMRANQVLKFGQSSRLTPASSRWFRLRPPSHKRGNAACERWCSRATETLVGLIGASNYYSRKNQFYGERGAFGTSAMEVTSGLQGKGLHFRTLPVGSFTIAENSIEEVDTVMRREFRTPAQLVEQYGKQVPEVVRALFDDPTKRHVKSEEVLHALYPRQDRDPRKADGMNKPVASCHIHIKEKFLLFEGGFDSMPVMVSRWETNPYSPWGWGPADYALPEAVQANFMEEMQDVIAETSAFPRVLYPAGMKDEIAFEAMGLTSFDPAAGENSAPREWLTQGRYDIWKDRAQDKKRNIEDSFFVDLFKAISRLDPSATATQISAIVSESREMFQPIHSNMIRESHIPELVRCFSLALQQGALDMPPPAMIEQDNVGAFIANPDVEFTSAFALAMEADSLGNLNAIINTLMPVAAADPTWFLPFNPNVIVPELFRQAGLPDNFTRSEEELAALAQQQAQAAQLAQAEQLTQGVRNLGGVDEAKKAAEMMVDS
jgi:hypothetical protein